VFFTLVDKVDQEKDDLTILRIPFIKDPRFSNFGLSTNK
jgi:hypothetical protein